MYSQRDADVATGPSTSRTSSLRSSELTATGRHRKGKKGDRVHGCVFCGKIYTRGEHLRRHQNKHKAGAFPCKASGCNCTFHSTDLLEKHEGLIWPFRFPALDPATVFKCPSLHHPSNHKDVMHRSASARSSTRATPSENETGTDSEEEAPASPTPSYTTSTSSRMTPLETLELSPRARFLDVPSRSPSNIRRRRLRSSSAHTSTSSPAVVQDTYLSMPSHTSDPSSLLQDHPQYRMLQRHTSDPNSAHWHHEPYSSLSRSMFDYQAWQGPATSAYSRLDHALLSPQYSTPHILSSTLEGQNLGPHLDASMSIIAQPSTVAQPERYDHPGFYDYMHTAPESEYGIYHDLPPTQSAPRSQNPPSPDYGLGLSMVGAQFQSQEPVRHHDYVHQCQHGTSGARESTAQGSRHQSLGGRDTQRSVSRDRHFSS